MEDHLDSLHANDPLHRRWIEQGKRNDETRRLLAESAAEPMPDIPHDQLVAHAAERWRQVGEATVIPDEAREVLLRLLAAGTTISEVARTLEVSKWTARTYLERLRTEGLALLAGKGRGARWIAAPQEAGGDGS
jgi:DNA-directed RNA polymerase specialized sigma24 family protein